VRCNLVAIQRVRFAASNRKETSMPIQTAFVMLQSLRGETPRHVERFTADFSDAHSMSRHAPR